MLENSQLSSYGLVVVVSSLRIFPNPKVMEVFTYIIFQTMYYFAFFFFFGLWCEVGIKFLVCSL